MWEEIDLLLENETWILTSIPPKHKEPDGKWFIRLNMTLKVKFNATRLDVL